MNNLYQKSTSFKGILTALLLLMVSLTTTDLLAQTFPTPGFTVPAGKTIVITYEVDVNADVCPNQTLPTDISNQSNVSGSNFSTVQTDEVAGAPITPTLTPVAGLTLGNLVYKDNNKNGVFDGGDAGIDGVLLNLYADDGDGVLDAGDGAAIGTATTAGGGLYSFSPLCPGDYIVEVAASNFNSGQPLYNNTLMSALISSPVGGAPDPDNDLNSDDNGDPVSGFGVASAAITLALGTEPITDGDADNNTNLTLDFGFKDPTTVSIADNAASESAGVLNFTVTRSDMDGDLTLNISSSLISPTSSGDFTAPSTVTILNGSTTGTLAVTLNNENIVEPNETFTVTLSGAPAGVVLTDDTATGTINNDDTATLTMGPDVSLPEGTTGPPGFSHRNFEVTLSAPVQGGFDLNFTVTDGTATDADDYNVLTPSPIAYLGNANEFKTIITQVTFDSKVELNESYTVGLASVTNTTAPVGSITFPNSPRTATIENDDSATISFSGNISQSEATTPQTFTVNLSNPVDVAVSMTVNTSDGTATVGDNDYQAVSGGTVTFNANSTTAQTVNVTINNDNKVEANEVYIVVLGSLNAMGRNVMLGTSTGTGTIVNDDSAVVTLSGGGSGPEGNSGTSGKTFTATLNNPVDGGFTIAYTTIDGTATIVGNDYQDNDGSLMFAGTANEMQTFTVNVNGDQTVEPDETFTTALGAVSGTSLGSSITTMGSPQTYTITNDDREISVVVSPSTVLEDGSTNLEYTFTRLGYSADSVTVFFSVGGTATFTTDYTQAGASFFNATMGQVHFTFNETTKVVTVNPETDMTSEPDETVVFTITPHVRYLVGTPNTATGTIEDDDNSVSVDVSPGTTAEDGSTNLVYTFTRTDVNSGALVVNFSVGGSATLTTDYTASGATTFNASSGTVTFSGTNPTAIITIDPVVDAIVEDNETVMLTVTSGVGYGVGSPSDASGTITNDDTATLTLSGGSSLNEANAGTVAHNFTATLSAAVQGGFTVPYTTNNGTAAAGSDYVDNDGMLTFSGTMGETQTITVLANGDITVELNETFTENLGAIGSTSPEQAAAITVSSSPQTATIVNDDAATVSIQANVSQAENLTPQTFTVTLSNPVDVAVTALFNTSNGTATTADSDYSAVTNQTVTFNAGTTTSQTVNVTINNDNKVENNEVYNVALGSLNAMSRNVMLGTSAGIGTIVNDDAAVVTLSGGGSANEGNTGTTPRVFTATLNNPVQGGFTVPYTTNDGSATSGSDYVDNDGTLTFAGTAGEPQLITVLVNGDFFVEPNETFSVVLGAISGAPAGVTTAGSPQTGTILNDEVDYGDAPDPTYPTLMASNGARHNTTFGFHLGGGIDGDADGQPGASANGDDTDAEGDDDDGVTLPSPLITNTTANVTVNASAIGMLDGWVDFNNNGSFADAGEKVFNNVALVSGNNNLSFAVPNGAPPAMTFARFRFSSAGGLSFSGAATDGEVEDYQVQIVNTQFSINDPTIVEGNAGTSNLAFTISRSNNASACSVNYAITGGTAQTSGTSNTGGNDYQTLAAGTASFTAGGALTQTVNVVVNGDMTVELNETVVMTLSNPVNGTILAGEGTGTIINDDAAIITITSPSLAEGDIGNATMTFNISMSNPADANVSFNFGTADGTATVGDNDYIVISGSHTLAPGEQSKQVFQAIVGDCKIELDETFSVVLVSLANNGRNVSFSGGGSTLSGTGTILNDDALPVITCAASFTKNTDPGQCSANTTLPLPTLGSVCGNNTLEFRHRPVDAANVPTGPYSSYIPAANNTLVFQKGKYEIEWRVTDGSGSSSCSHYLTVVDNEAPNALCQNITVQLSPAGTASITPSQIDNGSSDNCSFTLSLNNSSFTCANVGPNTVVLTATDPGNLSDNCTAIVTVLDNVPPVALCKNLTIQLDSTGNGSITASQVNNGSSDACGIQILSVTPHQFTCANVGTNTVVLTVTDVNNNSASCNAAIIVQDNVDPVAMCQSITISLNSDGTKAVSPSEINNGSSDACGIASMSLVPNVFSCNHIGVNTVILTVTDVNNNSSTCTATVTVNEFVVITNVVSTPETCTGSADGTIIISATTLGGTLAYSINGGVTFQFQNAFSNLSPGVYNIVVRAQGTANCHATATVTVGSGNGSQTWYKDLDNDGYSDGITQVSCTQPTGFKLPANLTALSGDCNDNDPLQYPGQIWYRDADNDSYSNGTTLISCTKPTGYKHASQLIQTSGDCNDGNAAIHPGATEICNGIDDDCDGQVDEGLANLIYNGNVVFSTQAQVNAWSQCYTVINGNLTIQNAGITNINTLTNLGKVTGNVLIKMTSLANLGGLVSLDSIGGNLTINNNLYGQKLSTLDGLDSLDFVGGNLAIFFNLKLSDCCAIHDLLNTPGSVGGFISIYNNLTGCESVAGINNACAPTFNLVAPPTVTLWVNLQLNQQLAPNVMAYYDDQSDQLNLQVNGPFSTGEAKLFDENGRMVLRQAFNSSNKWFKMMLGKTNPGNYTLQVLVDGNEFTQSLNIQ